MKSLFQNFFNSSKENRLVYQGIEQGGGDLTPRGATNPDEHKTLGIGEGPLDISFESRAQETMRKGTSALKKRKELRLETEKELNKHLYTHKIEGEFDHEINFNNDKRAEKSTGLKNFFSTPYIEMARQSNKRSKKDVVLAKRGKDGNYYTPDGKYLSVYSGDYVKLSIGKKKEAEYAARQQEFKKERLAKAAKGRKSKEAARSRLVSAGASAKALHAFNMAYDKRWSHEIGKIIKAPGKRPNLKDPKAWEKIHNQLMENKQYATQFKTQEKVLAGAAIDKLEDQSERYKRLAKRDIDLNQKIDPIERKLEMRFILPKQKKELEKQLATLMKEYEQVGREMIYLQDDIRAGMKEAGVEQTEEQYFASLIKEAEKMPRTVVAAAPKKPKRKPKKDKEAMIATRR